ncbi:LEM domain-containing protein 2 isoform X2 [Amblyraja radiata]|uniref:LEM domain-containing protein 2 isoform X2 n=1 Tax=Amblyraja radiata TaxID=386614 RepID=UPI00140424E9|nr:LEM domain-containing protein 2 isoform X2 [Amblyraja radiata]
MAASDMELRRELKSLGYAAGPVTDSTRALYVKKLAQLQSEKRLQERSGRTTRSSRSVGGSAAISAQRESLRPSAAFAGTGVSSSASRAWQHQDYQNPEEDDTDASADDRPNAGRWEPAGPGPTDRPYRATSYTDSHSQSRSSYSDPYARTFDSLGSAQGAATTSSQYSDPYARIFDSLGSYKRDSLRSDRYTTKTDRPSSDRFKGTTDNLFADRYFGSTDSLHSDRYKGTTDSLFSNTYTRGTSCLNLASRTGKRQDTSSDPYIRKSDSLSSDQYRGKLGNSYSNTSSKGLYSDTRYRGRLDSWSENEDESHMHRTSARTANNEKQRHKTHLVQFEFYLSRFLYISTIVLCLVLLALVYVKALGLVEGSQENINENIQMLPVDCSGKTDTFCRAEEHKMLMRLLTGIYEYLADVAGKFECDSNSPLTSKCVPMIDVKTHLTLLKVPNVSKFNEALRWIMLSSRDLGIRLVGEDSEEKITSIGQVACLESTRPQMNWYCRLQRAFFTILSRMLTFILVLSLLWIALLLLKYYSRKMEEQRQAMYEMVNKIIAVIRAHNQEWEKDLELVPYVPIPHVRDTLIQPKDRKKMKKIWLKSVQFLEASESRIRTETSRINGQDFLVWRWTQPSSLCDSM